MSERVQNRLSCFFSRSAFSFLACYQKAAVNKASEIDKTKFCLPHVVVVVAATVVVSHCVKLGKMWKMIFHFFLLLFVLICVRLKTICSMLIEHAMKNKYMGNEEESRTVINDADTAIAVTLVMVHTNTKWCKNTAKDSHFCIKPHMEDEKTARADDKADIQKMIFWRARERKKKYEMNMMEMVDGVLFINQTLCTQIHYSAKVVSFEWKYVDIGNFRMQNMNGGFLFPLLT